MIRTTTPSDVMFLAENARMEDIREARATTGLPIYDALALSYMASSDLITGINDKRGTPVLIAGVVPSKGHGCVWMVSAPDIKECAREVLEKGRAWLSLMEQKHNDLRNVVDERNKVHRSLLAHMGFVFGDPIERHGPGKITVLPFRRR